MGLITTVTTNLRGLLVACGRITPLPSVKIGEGDPCPIFPEGRGGGVCTQASCSFLID